GDRARPLRRTRLAGFPPSRHAVYSGLWIPDLRAGRRFPLRTTFRPEVRETCHFQWLPTPRRRRSVPNGTSPTQSRPSIAQWWSQSQGCCRAIQAAPADFHETRDEIYDEVVLTAPRPRERRPRLAASSRIAPRVCSRSVGKVRERRGPGADLGGY